MKAKVEAWFGQVVGEERMAVYMQVITFQLKEMDDRAYRAFCDEVAPAFAALPGLVSKVWIADPATGTYGGIYTWENQAACAAYLRSDLFNGVATHPNIVNATSREFAVVEAPTRVTRGLVAATV